MVTAQVCSWWQRFWIYFSDWCDYDFMALTWRKLLSLRLLIPAVQSWPRLLQHGTCFAIDSCSPTISLKCLLTIVSAMHMKLWQLAWNFPLWIPGPIWSTVEPTRWGIDKYTHIEDGQVHTRPDQTMDVDRL